MKDSVLRLKAGITTAIYKLSRNEIVHIDIFIKIRKAITCGLYGGLEIVREDKNDKNVY